MSNVPSRQPMPVQPLHVIPPPVRGERPGIISFIGVVSIIVSILSIVTAIGWPLWAVVLYADSRITPAAGISAPAVVPAAATTLDPQQRRIVIEGFMQLQPMDDHRANLLDALLAEHGLVIMPHAAGAVTAQGIARTISDHGKLPVAPGASQPQYFVVGNGKIELYDTHALYRPDDGGETLRVTGDDIVSERLPSGLSPADVKAAMTRINQITGNSLSSPQEQAIRGLLSSAGQTLLSRSGGGVESQIYAAWLDPAGMLTVVTAQSTLSVRSDGTIVSSAPAQPGKRRTISRVNGWLVAGASLAGVVNLLLAVLLMIAGILALRQSFKARMLHVLYAILRILAGILGGATLFNVWNQYSGGTADPGITGTFIIIWSIALLYPLILLILLNLPGVRAYYAR